MVSESISGGVWSDRENDLIVADYFEMLRLELSGETLVKAHRNRALQELIGRPHASIEFKHGNISAVLELLGLPTINGYKPMRNFQNALIAAVSRYMESQDDVDLMVVPPDETARPRVAEDKMIWIGPPPQRDPSDETLPKTLSRLIRKFDPARRDARNRRLGRLGEELVIEHERRQLSESGRPDLAKRVRWVSEEDGDGAGFDIHSYTSDGKDRLLEVKTTNGSARTPFFISENERLFSTERPKEFRLLRLYDFTRRPTAFELTPPLEDWLSLNPTSYRAEF